MEKMNGSKQRVCIIGAGPSGMSALYQYAKLGDNKGVEVVCYEKQSTWGGLWNYTWMTGTDEFGENCHGSMYKHLWTNAPKECQEFPDYTYMAHFGKSVPSYLPRQSMREYLEGRWTSVRDQDLKKLIKFNHVVQNVSYNKAKDEFTVSIVDLLKDKKVFVETFGHVIVAAGVFSVPHKPSFPGMDEFDGTIIHAHDFREARAFKGQRILAIGSSFSAEDIAIHCIKYGAERAICSWRNKPMSHKWPKGIEERPCLQKISGKTAFFQDGSSADVDAIILCTGYQYSFPFMEDDLKTKVRQISLYPDDLYKGVVWMKGGKNKLFYIGVMYQLYTMPMFDIQAAWIWRYILGQLENMPKSQEDMTEDSHYWLKKSKDVTNRHDAVEMQSEYLDALIADTGYNKNVTLAKEMWHEWLRDRQDNIGTFREKCFTSVHTGTKGISIKPWMNLFEENLDKM